MITSLIMMLFACECGDKAVEDTSVIPTEVVEGVQEAAPEPAEEELEDIPTEE